MRFSEFLTEALDSPVEFDITDDTEMPTRIYSSWVLDGDTYGASLEKTNHDKVYLLKMYRINGKKPMLWKFTSPTHLRSCFSTTLKFVEAMTPFLKTHMDGVIVQIPGKVNPSTYERFVNLIMKKTYINSFRQVPVSMSTEKSDAYNFIFFTRKVVSPTTLFKSKSFSKYEMDTSGTTVTIPNAVAEQIKPKKTPKVSVSTVSSTKFSFKGLAVEVTVDDETFEKIEKAEPLISKPVEEAPKASIPTKDALEMAGHDNPLVAIATVLPPSTVKKMILGGFDPSKVNADQFKSRMNAALQTNAAFKELVNKKKVFIPTTKEDIVHALEQISKFENFLKVETLNNYMIARNEQLNPKKDHTDSKMEIHKSTIDPETLETKIPGSGKFVDTPYGYMVEQGESLGTKTQHFEKTLGYGDWASKLAIQNTSQYNAIRAYTGSSSGSANMYLRKSMYEYLKNGNIEPDLIGNSTTKNMWKALAAVPPLPEATWVYRGSTLPEHYAKDLKPGVEYTDGGWMSTSLASTNTFSMSNLKLRIYLPKGSKVLPILNHSKHSSEREIILPPCSILKIIEMRETPREYGGTFYEIVGVFMGTVYGDIIDKVKKKMKGEVMTEEKKNEEDKNYDPNEKFGAPYDKLVNDEIRKQIKSGKMKPTNKIK